MIKKYLSETIKRKIKNLDANIIKAFEKVPREKFVFSGISVDDIYSDQAIPAYYGEDFLSTSSQPSLMALFFKESNLKEGMKVLEIGSGTGYNAAILSEIVGKRGLVITTEPEKEIYNIAKETLKNYNNVIVLNKDGYYGYEGKKFNAILSTVAVDGVPISWIKQLENGGKIIVPIVLGNDLTDYTFILEKNKDEVLARFLIHTSFLRALGKLSFKHKINLIENEYQMEKVINVPYKLFEFCITYFNIENKAIKINGEYGIYRNGILKFKGNKLLQVVEKIKNVDIFKSQFKGIMIYDYLNFIPY
ncbi:hypothetical protein JCM30566_05250 [Marinitoga arctica]